MSLRKVGRYEIESELGKGGMAVVYLAHDPYVKRKVAVKVLTRQFISNPHFRARFQREAEIIAALEHPAIVPIYDLGALQLAPDDEQPFIVMRFMTGGTLVERLDRGPLTLTETSKVLQRIGSALDRAHNRGIIHRDLKPENILFDQDGDAFLSDFGFAHLIETSTALTGSAIIGTPTYMSPEQIYSDKELDGRSDVYGLGVTLFEMLTGQAPYQDEAPAKVMMMHIVEPVPRILDVKPDLPPDCEEIIARAMAKEREERYQTATALATAFADLTSEKQTVEPTMREPIGAPLKTEPQAATLTATSTIPAQPSLSGVGEAKRTRTRQPRYDIGTIALGRWVIMWLVLLAVLAMVAVRLALPALAISYNNRGLGDYRAGQLVSAQVAFQRAIQLNPDYAAAHYNLGLVYEDLQDFENAHAEYQVAIGGGLVAAYNNLARLKILTGNYAVAVSFLLSGLDLTQDDEVRYDMLKNLGWARLEQGRYAEAEAALSDAIDLRPDRAPAHCLLARVLDSPQPNDEALPEWEACLQTASSRNPDEDIWIALARERLAEGEAP